MYQGFLKVILDVADGAAPVSGESVYVKTTGFTNDGKITAISDFPVDSSRYNYKLTTDSSGATQSVSIEAPDPALSLNKFSPFIPYSFADVFVNVPGYYPVRVLHAQIFAEKQSVLPITLTPLSRGYINTVNGVIVYEIPPNEILSDTQRTPEFSPDQTAAPMVATEVVIPEYVSVHLGKPDSNAENQYISFPDYIKNVASSEIYPTWPEETLKANILAIISITLNRIFTEWYPSQGYDFDITNSTQFDQAFVPGRNIFENISKLVDELFNTYIVRQGFINPLFAAFCDGKRTTCAGMSQWGSESLGSQGFSALNILKNYYGDNIELVTTDKIANIEETYPGFPLSLGAKGPEVEELRRKLYRISFNFPLIPKINPIYDVFDSALDSAVRVFQEVFGLTVDGIVGNATWYKISYVYASVIKLAELTAGGETGALPEEPPQTEIKRGDTGADVARLQFLLGYISLFYPNITSPALDGIFGQKTEQAVKEFQKLFSIPVTGKIGPSDWEKLYEVYFSILRSVTPTIGDQSYPGFDLQRGSRGDYVLLMQEYLNRIAKAYPVIQPVDTDGVFGPATENAVKAFQRRFFLKPTGIIDAQTWEQIVAIYNFLENQE
ncbi:MAG: spore cortex-lytic protein [Clostridiales bacterium]|nr:MAG: spore cortex-lytic protein [Clostridiales bacterium]